MKEKDEYSLEFFDKFFPKKDVKKKRIISKEEYNKFKKEFVKSYPKFVQGFKKRYEYWMEVIYKTIYDQKRCLEKGFTFDKFFHYYIKLRDVESVLKDFDSVTDINYEPNDDKYWSLICDSSESIKKHSKNWARIGAFYAGETPLLLLSEGERFKCFPVIENEKGEIVKRDEEKFGCDKIIEILTGKNRQIYDDDSRNHLNEYWQKDVSEELIKKIFIEMNKMIPSALNEYGNFGFNSGERNSSIVGGFCVNFYVSNSDPKMSKEEIKYFESQVESWESYEYSYEDGTTFHHFHSKNGFDIIKDNFVKIMKNVINDEKLEKAYLSFIKNVYVDNFPFKEFITYMQKNKIDIGGTLNENTLKNALLSEFKSHFHKISIDEIAKRMNEIKIFDPKKIKYFSMNYHSHSKNPADLDKLIKKSISGFSADNKIFVFELLALKPGTNIEQLILKAFKLDKFKNKIFNKPPKLKTFSANHKVALKSLWEYENKHTDLNKYGYFFEKDSKFYFVFQHVVFEEHVFTNEEIEINYSWEDIKDIQFISKEDINFFNIMKSAAKTHNEFSKIKKEKVYRCPVCKKVKYNSTKLLYNHVIREHNNDIPDNMPVEQFVFNLNNKKTHGTCVICGKETQWNPKTNKYHRLCSETCKEKYIKIARERLMSTHGTDDLSKDPEHQKKMLNNRKISSVYTFSDGTKVSTNSSYEKDFLQFNENHFHFTGKDIISCDIVFYYEFENKKHFYMPDFYIPDLNLIIEVKEKGSNASFIPRMRQMDLLKIEAVIKSEKYNFITVCGKEYDKYVELVEYLKEQENLNSEEKKLIIEIDKDNYGSALVPQKFVM